ncbi:MAG: hypothetical protein KAQ98_14100 [Bacteriovoracaceae bacterium]|nr:hypothetical protein [Bacteriovoracaceae bacterium]
MMNITYFNDGNKFKQKITPILEGDYPTLARNALLFSITEGITAGKYLKAAPLMMAVNKKEKIDLVSVMTPPGRPLVISNSSKESIDFLIDDLKSKKVHLDGVLGPVEETDYFSSKWGSLTNSDIKLIMNEGVYLLEKVIFPVGVKGNLKLAMKEDLEIVSQLYMKFIEEVLPNDPSDVNDVKESVKRGIGNKYYYLWIVEDIPVALVGGGGFADKFAKIAPVYTVLEHRKNGYGSAAVAELSKQFLCDGNPFCCLFTDLSNNNSNSVYQSIGYKRVGTLKQNKFIKREY